jgi:hypothetical protein
MQICPIQVGRISTVNSESFYQNKPYKCHLCKMEFENREHFKESYICSSWREAL